MVERRVDRGRRTDERDFDVGDRIEPGLRDKPARHSVLRAAHRADPDRRALQRLDALAQRIGRRHALALDEGIRDDEARATFATSASRRMKDLPFLALVVKKPLTGARFDLAAKAARALQAASDAVLQDPAGVAGEIQRQFFAKEAPRALITAVEAMKEGIAHKGELGSAADRRASALHGANRS
jgi:hypothetical protein